MKVFVTKYALTNGIVALEVEDCGSGMVREIKNSWPRYFHGEGKDWHHTWESALSRAEDMRSKKIASINKTIKKLQALQWGRP